MNFTLRRWTLGRIMVVVAAVAGVLAAPRSPALLGGLLAAMLLGVILGMLRRRPWPIMALFRLYPGLVLLPMLAVWDIHWLRGLGARSKPGTGATLPAAVRSGLLGAELVLSVVGIFVVPPAYLQATLLALAVAEKQAGGPDGGRASLERVATAMAVLMPVCWVAFLVFTTIDPFGAFTWAVG